MNPFPSEAPSSGERKVVLFSVCGETCALPIEEVAEVVSMAKLMKPFGLPPFLEGFLNLGGRAVPVIRLDSLFHLSALRLGLYTKIIIIRAKGSLLGLIVDQVDRVYSAPPEALLPVGNGLLFNGCVEAEVSYQGEAAHLLSVARLLIEEEQRAVATFESVAQKRMAGIGGDEA